MFILPYYKMNLSSALYSFELDEISLWLGLKKDQSYPVPTFSGRGQGKVKDEEPGSFFENDWKLKMIHNDITFE